MSTKAVCRPGAMRIQAMDAVTTGNVQPAASNIASLALEPGDLSPVLVSDDRSSHMYAPLTSIATQIFMTIGILLLAVFVLGFIADPIINLYLDPWSFFSPWSGSRSYYYEDDEPSTWYEHFAKGFASMGVLGFLKVLIASPLSYFRIGGGRGRNTGRDRYEQVSWIIILIGVGTFLLVCCTLAECSKTLTSLRPLGKELEHGVVARLKKLESELWMFKVRKTMTTIDH